GGELPVQREQAGAVLHPELGGVAPAGLLTAQLVTALQAGERLLELTQVPQRVAEVAVGLGQLGLVPDRPAVVLDRLPELPAGLEVVAQVVVTPAVPRVEGDGPAVLVGGLVVP